MRSKSLLRGLGDEIREQRRLQKLSQESLAGMAGIHRNVIGRLERGIYNPTLLLLQAVAMKLNVSLEALIAAAERRR